MRFNIARQPRLLVIDQGKDSVDRLADIKAALEEAGISTVIAAIQNPTDLGGLLAREQPDLAFSTFFRFPGIGEAPAYLSHGFAQAGIPHIGSEDSVLEVALSKPAMKASWRKAGIPTPDWFTIAKTEDGSLAGLEKLSEANAFPYFVKPAGEGNSRGIDAGSIIRTPIQLFDRATMIAERFGEALIENYIGGGSDSSEFTVAMIGNGSRSIVSAVQVGSAVSGLGLITEEAKDGHRTVISPISDPRLKRAVEKIARRVFLCSGVKDYARCDILLHEGRLYAIELNGQPMVPDRWFAACSQEAGLDGMQYIRAIVLAAIVRIMSSGESFMPIPRALAQSIPEQAVTRLSGPPGRTEEHE